MIKINTIAVMAATGILGYSLYNLKMENADLHKKMDLLVETNMMTHESLQLETHNRKQMGEQMMVLQTQYQENAVALNAVGNLKNQLEKISTWTDDLVKPELVWKNIGGNNKSGLKESNLGRHYTLESCN